MIKHETWYKLDIWESYVGNVGKEAQKFIWENYTFKYIRWMNISLTHTHTNDDVGTCTVHWTRRTKWVEGQITRNAMNEKRKKWWTFVMIEYCIWVRILMDHTTTRTYVIQHFDCSRVTITDKNIATRPKLYGWYIRRSICCQPTSIRSHQPKHWTTTTTTTLCNKWTSACVWVFACAAGRQIMRSPSNSRHNTWSKTKLCTTMAAAHAYQRTATAIRECDAYENIYLLRILYTYIYTDRSVSVHVV